MWTTIRLFNTPQFSVALQCEPEQFPDLSWMEESDLAKIESGEWQNVTFRVVVLWRGIEIGADFLGNSVYEDVTDFAREHIGIAHTGAGAYFPDMLATAVAQARRHLRDVPKMRNILS